MFSLQLIQDSKFKKSILKVQNISEISFLLNISKMSEPPIAVIRMIFMMKDKRKYVFNHGHYLITVIDGSDNYIFIHFAFLFRFHCIILRNILNYKYVI